MPRPETMTAAQAEGIENARAWILYMLAQRVLRIARDRADGSAPHDPARERFRIEATAKLLARLPRGAAHV